MKTKERRADKFHIIVIRTPLIIQDLKQQTNEQISEAIWSISTSRSILHAIKKASHQS
jgi:hypothetical protein